MQNHSNNILESVNFLATLLHEIRTPIQTIIGSSELLNNTELNQEQKEYIRQIQFSADALLSLANNILDYSKVNNKDFTLENAPFDLVDLVESTTDLICIEAFNKGLEIVTDIDIATGELVMGDQTRIQQVLMNIIKNAVKFTPQGYIYVSVTISSNNLLFKIHDTGIGVPKEAQEKLFKAYYQADASTTRKYGGTGLGLAICKSLITAMNGQIGITSNPEGGSIFYFQLPYNPIPQENKKSNELVIPAKTKILIVDDSIIATNSLVKKLHRIGIKNISTASTAQEALNLMKDNAKKQQPFTSVFIDLLLPKVDGWHLAAEINNDKEINNSKLFLLIPEGQMGSEARMKMLNWFDGYLYKPLKQKKLFELISQSIKESFENAINEQRDPNIVLQERNLAKKQKEENLPENIIKAQTENLLRQKKEAEIAKGLTVLIVEDHLVNRKLLNTFLQKFGATVIEAENGNIAVEKVKQNPQIDYIFMDIQMPIKNGIDATKEIRQLNYKGIIIACTANSDKNDFEIYKETGMNDVLVKPFKSAMVKDLMEKWNTALLLPSAKDIFTLQNKTTAKTILWNETDFLDTVSNDFNFAKSLLNDFIIQTESLLSSIPNSIEKKDFEELRRIGHTIDGSSSTISAISLSEHGKELNKAAKSEDIELLKKTHKELTSALKKFKTHIKKWIMNNEL
jgi:CheY-like chemotaxis protein